MVYVESKIELAKCLFLRDALWINHKKAYDIRHFLTFREHTKIKGDIQRNYKTLCGGRSPGFLLNSTNEIAIVAAFSIKPDLCTLKWETYCMWIRPLGFTQVLALFFFTPRNYVLTPHFKFERIQKWCLNVSRNDSLYNEINWRSQDV